MKIAVAALALALTTLLTACDSGPSSSSAAQAASAPVADAYLAAQNQAKGFVTGNMMAARTVYVYFDAQCPHCGHLWKTMKAFNSQLKVVWVPVGLLNQASFSQGVAILNSADPVKTMDEHEAIIAAGNRGMAASIPSSEQKSVIEANSKLFASSGGESVPFIVSKNPTTGQTVTAAGALPEPQLRQMLSL
jgi:thiol:disulfide interchange protein DsbG